MTAKESNNLSHKPDFIGQIRILGAKVCIQVVTEAHGGQNQPTNAQHNLRAAYATRFLLDSEKQAELLTAGVVADLTINKDTTDDDLVTRIALIFDAFAGVVPAAT